MKPDTLDDAAVRLTAIEYVNRKAQAGGGVVTRAELEQFTFRGYPLKLIDKGRGIRNPIELPATLSILSTEGSPYRDIRSPDGLIQYDYRVGSSAGDNRKLKAAAASGVPIIFLKGIADAVFVPVAPAYVVRDSPQDGYFEIAIDEALTLLPLQPSPAQRSYVERLMKVRLHQPVFRAQVIRAYERRCAMCRLNHPELLDAAHIVPDSVLSGDPVVSNGLSLCKIHHAAYDQNVLGIRPDLVIEVQPSVLIERDGPMLLHGIQEMKGSRISVPRARADQPDQDRLAARYAEFAHAS